MNKSGAAGGRLSDTLIASAYANIEKMPVGYITHPGSANRQLFESGFSRVRATGRPIVLSRQYLAQFGRFRIPAPLWQALGQYACWLDPVIVREWPRLTSNWDSDVNQHSATRWGAAVADNVVPERDDAAEGAPATNDAFEWTESRHDTNVTLERVSSCAVVDLRSPACGRRRESDPPRTSTTVFPGRAGATTIFGTCCRPAATSISAKATGCPLLAPWPTPVAA